MDNFGLGPQFTAPSFCDAAKSSILDTNIQIVNDNLNLEARKISVPYMIDIAVRFSA